MSLFDQLVQQAQGLDLGAIAQRVGLSPDQVATAGRALLPQIADPNVDNHQATADVAAQTGIDHSQLSAMVPAILEQAKSLGASGGPFASVLAGLGGGAAPAATNAAPATAPAAAPAAAGGESIFDKIKHAVDQDGDGNPLNDIMNKLGGH
ncbi:hypothetical protein [Allosphingosinicella sp.]|uniref:hypothetical protein n=1 Tax=Allosphingosinicella sp. TaxID=2823234 RepID=UPI003784FE7C